MAYIRKCKECGQRISLREVRKGQWVAFDVSTSNRHVHGQKPKGSNKKSPLKKVKKAQGHAALTDLSGNVWSLEFLPDEWLDLDDRNKVRFLERLIETKTRVKIEYVDAKGSETTRTIYPHHLDRKHRTAEHQLGAYCELRSDYRNFVVGRIGEVLAGHKAPPKMVANADRHFGEKRPDLSQPQSSLPRESAPSFQPVKLSQANSAPRATIRAERDSDQSETDSRGNSLGWAVIIALGLWLMVKILS